MAMHRVCDVCHEVIEGEYFVVRRTLTAKGGPADDIPRDTETYEADMHVECDADDRAHIGSGWRKQQHDG